MINGEFRNECDCCKIDVGISVWVGNEFDEYCCCLKPRWRERREQCERCWSEPNGRADKCSECEEAISRAAGVADADADGGMSVTTGIELESSAQLTRVEVVGLGSDGSLVGTTGARSIETN